jgi:hypothetical protein
MGHRSKEEQRSSKARTVAPSNRIVVGGMGRGDLSLP